MFENQGYFKKARNKNDLSLLEFCVLNLSSNPVTYVFHT